MVLGMFAWPQNVPVHHVCLCTSLCINAAPPGQLSTEFDIWNSYENLLRKTKFSYNQEEILGILHQGISKVFCCWQQ